MAAEEELIERQGRWEIIRRKEFKQLEIALRHGEYILISAPLQCGLSTFLRQASELVQSRSDLRDYEPVVYENFDWEDDLFVHLAGEVANRLRGEVKNEKSRLWRYGKILEEKGAEALFKSAFGRSSQIVVFFLDNFQNLPLARQKEFVTRIRQLHTYRTHSEYIRRILFVMGGNLRWQKLDPDRTSPFSNAASKILLSDFNLRESSKLLHHLFSQKGTSLGSMACEYLYEITLGHPYFLQTMAKILLSHRPDRITFQQIDRALHTLLEEGDRHLREVRESLLEKETDQLKPLLALLQGKSVKRSVLFPDERIESLITLGVIKVLPDNHLGLRNPIYSQFLRNDPVLEEKFSHQWTLAPAHLLSYPFVAANKEGYCLVNQLENQLRNFIVSQLYGKYGQKWLEEGLKEVNTDPERDREKGETVRNLAHVLALRQKREKRDFPLATREAPLLAYATLKELQVIVVKNWKPLFKPHLGSQDRFKVYLTTLNRIRNKLAHNRPLFDEEIDKLKEMERSFRKWMGRDI